MIQGTDKSARLDFRLQPEFKQTIERAAARMGQTVSEFAVATLIERARRVLEQEARTQLSGDDRDLFLKLLDEDSPNDALRAAADIYKQQVEAE